MQELKTTETFTIPAFARVLFRVLSVVMIFMGIAMIWMNKDANGIIFLCPVFLFLAWSMFAYTRQQLTISEEGIRFVGGWRPHNFTWADITQVDMALMGKYDDPQVRLYYANRELEIKRSVFLKKKFMHILSLLEIKIPAALFTPKYQEIKNKLDTQRY